MTIELRVDSLDDVDEAIREDYVEAEDGKFVLKGITDMLGSYVHVDKITEHEKTAGLKSALDKEREARKELERSNKDLAAKAGDAMTPEEKKELDTLRQVKADATDKQRRAEGEFDVWRTEEKTRHADEIKGLVTERDTLRSGIITDRVSRDIVSAINEFGGRANILEPLIRLSVGASYEDGKVNIAVNDAAGVRRLDSEGQPLSIRSLVEGMSTDKEFGDLFKSTQKSGGGSTSEGGDTGEGDGDKGGNPEHTDEQKSQLAGFKKILDDGGQLPPADRLQYARLRGTAPTTEQLDPNRKTA